MTNQSPANLVRSTDATVPIGGNFETDLQLLISSRLNSNNAFIRPMTSSLSLIYTSAAFDADNVSGNLTGL